jgi:hypothetical protein
MTSRLLLAARRCERATDRRLLAPALVAGAADERSRFAAAEEAPAAPPQGRAFMTLLRQWRKCRPRSKKPLAIEDDSHK